MADDPVSREHQLVTALEDMTSLAQTMLRLHRLEAPATDEAMESFRTEGDERVKAAWDVLAGAITHRLGQVA